MFRTPVFRFALRPHTWLVPLGSLLVLAVLFPLIYLTATVDPQENLTGLPVALVVEAQTGDPGPALALAAAVQKAVDPRKIALRRLEPRELTAQMDQDALAAAVIVPAGFSDGIRSLAAPGSPGPLTVPAVLVRTNAGDGGLSNGLAAGNLLPVLGGVRQAFGAELVQKVRSAGRSPGPAEAYLLGAPFTVDSGAYAPLPARSGFGTSAFYYTLILVLLGFVGASVINPSVDAALGFAPAELGPLVARRPYQAFTRRQTFLIKGGIALAGAPAAALVVLALAGPGLGLPVPDPAALWAFSTAAIFLVAAGCLAVFAVFGGGIGALVNTLVFVALAMTSSGGTVPLAALPPFFQAFAGIDPFRIIVAGVRDLLYFGGRPEAGLADSWPKLAGLLLGELALGLAVTTLYARNRRFTRAPRP